MPKSVQSMDRDKQTASETKKIKTHVRNATVVTTLAIAGSHSVAYPVGAAKHLLLPFEGREVDVILEDGVPFLEIRHDVVVVYSTHPLVKLDPGVV